MQAVEVKFLNFLATSDEDTLSFVSTLLVAIGDDLKPVQSELARALAAKKMMELGFDFQPPVEVEPEVETVGVQPN